MINWTNAHAAYLRSGLTKAAFHRTRLHEFLEPGDSLPSTWVLYDRFRRIEKNASDVVPRSSSKLIKVIGDLRPSRNVPAVHHVPQVPVQLELPGGARLTFATAAPENFAAALIRMTSEFAR